MHCSPMALWNRPWIADHVFGANAAPGARERLDAIEHPLIYAEAARLEHEAPPRRAIIIHDIPLLAEVIDDIPFAFDHIVTVEAPVCMRLDRMVEGTRHEPGTGRGPASATNPK